MTTMTKQRTGLSKAPWVGADKNREQNIAWGKLLRQKTAREAHAGWQTPKGRRNPVDILKESNKGREPALIPIRFGRMLQSAFAFFRGAASIMAADLSTTINSNIYVQACGDCHLVNFGGFASPERRMVFDINDFDETLPAPWEWDVKRLAASFVIASMHNGIDKHTAESIARICVASYRNHTSEYAGLNMIDIWYSNISFDDIMQMIKIPAMRKRVKKRLEKATGRNIVDEDFPKLAELKDGKAYIKDNPPLIYHYNDLDMKKNRDEIKQGFETYSRALGDDKKLLLKHYRLHDIAAKVVGVGSVGRRCGISLRMSANNDPLFLQVKEAAASVMEPYAGKSQYKNHGKRVVCGQKLMQAASDLFLGWTAAGGRHYYVRQLRDKKIKPLVETFDYVQMTGYASLCGWALARAHARSGNAAIISGYLGNNDKFDKAVAAFALDYAAQNEKDFDVLLNAVKKGTVQAYFEQ